MRTRLTIGPILGVRLVVTPSWIIVLGIVVFALEALGVFPAELPLAARLALGALVGVLFLASLAAHELAHAVVARRAGLQVNEIGLAVIGSQGELERQSATGRGEIGIALAGPAVSLLAGSVVIGASFALLGGTDAWVGALAEVLWLVGLSNLLVGGLNLLPGFPFDGGRMLRGIVLMRTGDSARATSFALRAGRLLSFAMMGLGIALALAGRFVDGVWLVVLGWLLSQSNKLHQRRNEIEQLAHGLSVDDVMERSYPIVPPSLTVDALLAQHEQRGESSTYPVAQGERLIGAIDVVRILRLPEARRLETRVEELMTRVEQLTVLTGPTSIVDALQSFDRTRADALPVVDEVVPSRLVGMLTRDGLIATLRARRSARQAIEQAR